MKKTVLGSVLALAVSIALLAGATFAWFTDSIVNSGNTITAGTLRIEATAYDYDAAGAGGYVIAGVNGGNALNFETEGQDLRTDGAAIIRETNWEPGASNAKLLKVENAGTLAAKVKLDFTTSGELTDALWFDFIQVEGGDIAGTFTKRPMNKLAELAENLEFQLKATEKVEYIFVYGMYEDAGNDYQGKSFAVDVTVFAKQAAVEEDGFGNTDYDANAEYDIVNVSSAEEFQQAVANGKSINLLADIEVPSGSTYLNDAVIDINDNKLTIGNGTGSIKAGANHTLTINGNGTVFGTFVIDSNAKLVLNVEEDFSMDTMFVTGAAISGSLNSSLEIRGGTYTSSNKGGGAVINFLGSELYMQDAVVNVKVDSVMQAQGINANNAKSAVLENVTVNGNYSTAVVFNSASGNYVIRGGFYSTAKKAEGLSANPTIKYQGTLKISDATIERIGLGIKYNVYNATEAENLTLENVVFTAVQGASDEDVGI